MKWHPRWTAGLAACSLAVSVAATPALAGRLHSVNDTAFELSRIKSGGVTETIAANETTPAIRIQSNTEALFAGFTNRHAEFAEVWTWDGVRWTRLSMASPAPGVAPDFTFKSEVITPPDGTGAYSAVSFRFAPDKVHLIQNKWVEFYVFPQGPENPGDNMEGLQLYSP